MNLDAKSLDESTTSILCTPTQSVLYCDQWFHDGLKFLFHYLLLLERTLEWALSPSNVGFCLLFICNGLLIQMLIENQMKLVYLAYVPL